jgi:hypothetical protein
MSYTDGDEEFLMDPDRPKDDDVKPADAGADQSGGASYEKPVLTNYGTLARLTRNGTGTLTDGLGTMRMACL